MTITISKSEILNEVEKRSSLEGLVQPDKFDILWASSEVGELLESYWIGGYTAVIQLLKRYLSSSTITYDLTSADSDEVLEISVAMPLRYNYFLEGSIINDIKMMIACNILSGWMSVIAPDVSAKYDTESNSYVEDLRVKLLYRTSPVCDESDAKEDTEVFAEEVALPDAKEDTEILVQYKRCSELGNR